MASHPFEFDYILAKKFIFGNGWPLSILSEGPFSQVVNKIIDESNK